MENAEWFLKRLGLLALMIGVLATVLVVGHETRPSPKTVVAG
jgi:hypothetical protein